MYACPAMGTHRASQPLQDGGHTPRRALVVGLMSDLSYFQPAVSSCMQRGLPGRADAPARACPRAPAAP